MNCQYVNNIGASRAIAIKKMLLHVVCMLATSPLFAAEPIPPTSPTTNDLQSAYNRMATALSAAETGGEYSSDLAAIQSSLDTISSRLVYQNNGAAQWLFQIRQHTQTTMARCASILASVGVLTNQVNEVKADIIDEIQIFENLFLDFTSQWEWYFNELLNHQANIEDYTWQILNNIVLTNITVNVAEYLGDGIAVTNPISIDIDFEDNGTLQFIGDGIWNRFPNASNTIDWASQPEAVVHFSKWLINPMADPHHWTNTLLNAQEEQFTMDFSSLPKAFSTSAQMQSKLLNEINEGIFRLVTLSAEGSRAAEDLDSAASSYASEADSAIREAQDDADSAFDKETIQSTVDPLKSAVESYRDDGDGLNGIDMPSEFRFTWSGGEFLGFQYETISFDFAFEGRVRDFCEFVRSMFLWFLGLLGAFFAIAVLYYIGKYIYVLCKYITDALGAA